MKNNKAQLQFLILPIVLGIILVIAAIGFIASTTLRFTIIGVGLIVMTIIYVIPAAMQGELTKNKVTLILIMIFAGIVIALIPHLGFLQETALSSSFTPVYCRQPLFTCCGEVTSSQSLGSLAATSNFLCPTNSNKCILSSFTGGYSNSLYKGKTSCSVGYHPTLCGLLGSCFYCSDYSYITAGNQLSPGDYLFSFGSSNNNVVVTVYNNRLAFCGLSACDGGTTGVEVSGSDGCTFNPSATYDSTGKLISFNVSGTSYTAKKGSCVLNWQDGQRYICGNLEEQCSADSDCTGHTYGNYECNSRTLVEYGCDNNGLPNGVTREASGTLFGGNARPNQVEISGVISRCDVKATRQVSCCGDTDCGQNAFCDNSRVNPTNPSWTCKATVSCTQDTQCGVSQVCDFANKKLIKPACVSGQCKYADVQTGIQCCSASDCSNGYYCGTDHMCKASTNPKRDCPNECCLGLNDYFDKPCPSNQFCINGKCTTSGCKTDSECAANQRCDNGNCVDKDLNLKPTDCNWYEHYVDKQIVNYQWYNYIGLGKPVITSEPTCENWIGPYIILGIIIGVFILIIAIMYKPKKRRK